MEYRSKDVQRIADVSKDKLSHWTRCRIIKPLYRGKGRGDHSIYSEKNLIEVLICRDLSKFCIESHKIKEIVASISKELDDELEGWTLTAFGDATKLDIDINKLRAEMIDGHAIP